MDAIFFSLVNTKQQKIAMYVSAQMKILNADHNVTSHVA